MRSAKFIIPCLIVLIAGCASTLGPRKIVPGQSESDVVALSGKPSYVYQNPDGSRQLEYNNQPYGVTNYMVTVDANGKVTKVVQALSDDNLNLVKVGMTHDDILRLLGAPMSAQTYALSKEEAWEWNIDNFGYGGQLKRFDVFFKDGKVLRTETRLIDPYECGMAGCFPN